MPHTRAGICPSWFKYGACEFGAIHSLERPITCLYKQGLEVLNENTADVDYLLRRIRAAEKGPEERYKVRSGNVEDYSHPVGRPGGSIPYAWEIAALGLLKLMPQTIGPALARVAKPDYKAQISPNLMKQYTFSLTEDFVPTRGLTAQVRRAATGREPDVLRALLHEPIHGPTIKKGRTVRLSAMHLGMLRARCEAWGCRPAELIAAVAHKAVPARHEEGSL